MFGTSVGDEVASLCKEDDEPIPMKDLYDAAHHRSCIGLKDEELPLADAIYRVSGKVMKREHY